MLRRHPKLFLALFVAWELALTGAAFVAAAAASAATAAPGTPPAGVYLPALPFVIALAYIAYRTHELYLPRREGGLARELAALLRATGAVVAVGLVLGLVVAVPVGLPTQGIAATAAAFAIFNAALLAADRVALRFVLRAARRRGYNLRHACIVGAGRTAEALLERLRREPWMGIRVRGVLRTAGDPPRTRVGGVPVLGDAPDVAAVVRREGLDQVYVAVPLERFRAVREVLRRLEGEFVSVRVVLDLDGLPRIRHRLVDLEGLPVLHLCEGALFGWKAAVKRAMDLALGFGALIVSSPLMAWIALCLKSDRRQRTFYRQVRVGLDGRPFRIWKFRTMRGPDDVRPAWTRPGDPRVTPLGRLLRRTSLDELPQLFNVITGEMSLVGPRPERPYFIERFRRSIPHYQFRHKVKAGLTGWAQVHGWRGCTSPGKRLEYDLHYIEQWSLGLDLKILWLTLRRGFVDRNAY